MKEGGLYDYRREWELEHRTHLYYLDYSYEMSCGNERSVRLIVGDGKSWYITLTATLMLVILFLSQPQGGEVTLVLVNLCGFCLSLRTAT